jgi:hypothetical protein
MHTTAYPVREYAAFAVLGALLMTVLAAAFAVSAVLGGAPGLVGGLAAGAGTAQLLRRPAGRAIGRLVA